MRAACRLWLRTAALCKPPASARAARLAELVSADEYGAREELLRSANLLLDEAALRGLVKRFETELASAMAADASPRSLPHTIFGASAALALLSQALRDADVHVRAVLQHSPQPNPLQQEQFVRAYLEYGQPQAALEWLDGDWQHHESARLRLRADALASLGRDAEAAAIRRQLSDETAAGSDLRAWIERLPAEAHAAAIEHARERARAEADPLTAARLLVEIGDTVAAEAVLIAHVERIDGGGHVWLVPLAETLEAQGRWRGATACYRALLQAILARGHARAYSHAARYYRKLGELAGRQPDLQPLGPHAAFEATLRSKHGRKASFRSQVSGAR